MDLQGPVRFMQMRNEIDIWNILHDGDITAAGKGHNNSYTLFVSIPYLRRRLAPLGDSFVLALKGVRQIAFQNFDGTISTIEDEMNLSTPEILRTDSESMPISVETTTGKLLLDFEGIEFRLDTGQPVDFETLETVCRDYWDEWRKKSERKP